MKSILNIFFALFLVINLQAMNQGINKSKTEPELDKSIRHGKLKNGLTYFIKHLPEEQSNLSLRLLVKAGYNHQDDDQLNIAHFLEHMAFKTSKHFPNGIHYYLENSLVDDMSKFSINGHTGSLNTQYIFNAPVYNKTALGTGLLWFKDIAMNLALTTEDIDSERGVLIQELITRSADNFSKSYNRSQLINRLIPCNHEESNFIEQQKSFNPEILRKYYKDWYRPERMAVVVVGNITNMDDLVTNIRSSFSSIRSSKDVKLAPDCDSLYFNQPPRFANLEKMPDAISTNQAVTMELLFRDPESAQQYEGFDGIKRERKLAIFLAILNERLKESSSKYNTFYDIMAEHTNRTREDPSAIKLQINSKSNDELKALKVAVRTISEIIKGGVLDSEFNKIKKDQLENLAGTKVNNSSYWLNGIKDYYISMISLPKKKLKAEKQFLLNLTFEDFNDFVGALDLAMPEDIGISAPINHPALSYTEGEIRSLIMDVYERNWEPYTPPTTPDFLMSSNEIYKLQEKDYTEIQSSGNETREFLLDNGVRLIIKSFEPNPGGYSDKILLHAFNPRGALNFNTDDYYSAIAAPEILKNNGIGSLDKFEFQRFISHNSLWWHGIKPYIRNLESGIEIDAKPEDLEIMLQVVYFLFSKPNNTKDAFDDWKKNEIQMFENQHIDLKDIDLLTNIAKIIDDDSGASYGTDRFNGINKVNKDRSYEIYKQLLGNANDFTFILTGNFPIEKYLPLLNKYLGNLPTAENSFPNEIQNLSKLKLPEGPVYIEFMLPDTYTKKNLMYRPHHIIFDDDEFDWEEYLKLKTLGTVIDNEVWELRFEKGYSIYTTGAAGEFNHSSEQYVVMALFDCPPEQLPSIRKEYEEIISNLKSNLISNEILEQGLKRIRLQYDSGGKIMSNRGANDKLYNEYRFNRPAIDALKIKEFIERIDPEDIRETARKYLKEDYFYEFVMKGRT